MAYQALGRGTSANDGTGDDLRTGAGKLNANFVEVYTKLGDGSTLTADTVTLNAATQTLTNKSLTSPTITGTGAIAGTFTGNITGNVTGDVTGSVTGNVTGNLTGDVTGDITGGVTGNLIGNASTASGNFQITPATNIVEVRGDGSSVEGQIILNCHANSHGQTIKPQPHSAAVTNTMLLPDGANSTLVSEVATQTLTNKTLTSATLTGLFGSVQTLSGAGAVNLTDTVTEITSTGADPLTLANGTVGQVKVITMIVDGGDATLTPTTFAGGSTITFNDAGDSVILVYNTTVGWVAVANQGATVA
jgi:hypothetical protein